MKIALVGATGNVGIRLVSELTRRGHRVTAIVYRRHERYDNEGGREWF